MSSVDHMHDAVLQGNDYSSDSLKNVNTNEERIVVNPSLIKKISSILSKLVNFIESFIGKELKCGLKKSLHQLNRTENSRYNPQLVAQRLLLEYKNPSFIKQVLNRLEKEDKRFNGEDKNFKLDQAALQELKTQLELLKNSGINKRELTDIKTMQACQQVLPKKEEKQKEELAKLQQKIASDIIGIVIHRNPVKVPVIRIDPETKRETRLGTMSQIQGHVKVEKETAKFIESKSISAEMQKTKTVNEIANHGVITLNSMDGESEVIVSRSSRTDTQKKIKDKSSADILARLNTTSKKGLIKGKDKNGIEFYTYRRSDVTLMDTDLLKAIATTVVSGAKSLVSLLKGKGATNLENERLFINNKREATQKLFKEAGKQDVKSERIYIEHTCIVDGKKFIVREYQPNIFNFVFSGQAENITNIKNSRQDNIQPTLNLLKQLASEKSSGFYDHYIQI